MADSIKIGNLDISSFKVGSSDCKIYLGTTLLYSGGTTPPTPTYEWKQYNAGDTVPSATFYGVKLYGLELDGEIDFSVYGHSGVAFIFDTSNDDWAAIDMASQNPIDISEYYDETERCYTIYFSDLGYGGMPINYPVPSESFEFDVQLYEEYVPPTPTYEWKQYNAGDTVPSKLFYGVKLGDPSMNTTSIEFGDTINDYIGFGFDVSSENGWYAIDLSGKQIDISEYYDETERCYTIYFSDFGLGAMPLYIPAPSESFEFDVKLYEEHTSTLQWVTYNNGDTIPSDLDIYGISGVSQNLYDTFGYGTHFQFTPSRNKFDWYIANDSGDICYFGGSVLSTEVISAICSEVSCDDYYNQGATVSGTIQLYIYA